MNAVIALCHFCDRHGPSAIFCTQTLRDTKIDDCNFAEELQQFVNKNCSLCNSIGNSGIISKDLEHNANFLSTQVPVIPEVRSLIKQASIRSLSCEINSFSKDSFVFFGDASRGHVLSHTFHVSDIQARGFNQLFSIIILMKDKLFLLNIKPFLAENLQKISEELKSKAKILYDLEQENGSGRNQRLTSGENSIQSPRSLMELTNDKNIFSLLHTHFTWILLAGTRVFREEINAMPWSSSKQLDKEFITLTKEKLTNTSEKSSLPPQATTTTTTDSNTSPAFIPFRDLKHNLKSDFISACYCALTGIKIIIRGPPDNVYNSLMCFRKILPYEMHKLTHYDSPQYLSDVNGRIVTVAPEIAVPLPSKNIYRIDFFDEGKISVKWHGSVPQKLPNVLNKILKAVDENLFTDFVLDKHLKVLIEEWKNKVVCLNCVKSSSDAVKMKKVLDMQPQDLPLVDYWKLFL